MHNCTSATCSRERTMSMVMMMMVVDWPSFGTASQRNSFAHYLLVWKWLFLRLPVCSRPHPSIGSVRRAFQFAWQFVRCASMHISLVNSNFVCGLAVRSFDVSMILLRRCHGRHKVSHKSVQLFCKMIQSNPSLITLRAAAAAATYTHRRTQPDHWIPITLHGFL